MTEAQPDPGYRAEMLLDFWFARERASERDRLRDKDPPGTNEIFVARPGDLNMQR